MASPAERYADSRRRAIGPQLQAFLALVDFPLDEFQLEAARAVEAGRGVLVAAPTGAGKTVVGEFAIHLALATGRKAFYTTPIKALSNQKYHDLAARYGAEQVGLLTGDISVNGQAPVVVMTTEVLRNMMYAGSSALTGLGFVVMDEVHYLADRFRGAVWEEVIIHLPPSVQLISLSATVSNAEEFGDWLRDVRGEHEVVISERRPVPLWQHMLVGHQLFDLFRRPPTVNPQLLAAVRALDRAPGHAPRRHSRGPRAPRRSEIVRILEREGMLPAITFIFSRIGCDSAVQQLLLDDVRLIPPRQGAEIRRLADARVSSLSFGDLAVLGYDEFADGLSRGFAAHHAGMLPLFREIVEELFASARIRLVFATETLALGVNMPARTVVIEKLVKFNGENHAPLTPAEFTQLTGRAGRRGIDLEGHAVVPWRPDLDPQSLAGLASTRTYPLRSTFRPTSNMAVNLVGTVGQERAVELLRASFAQFQADRAVVDLAMRLSRATAQWSELDREVSCERGDFAEYAALREQIGRLEKSGSKQRQQDLLTQAQGSLDALRQGDVIHVPAGRRPGWAVVIAPGNDQHPPRVLTEGRQARTLTTVDVPMPIAPVTRLRIPRGFNSRSPQARRDLANSLRLAVPFDPPRKNRTTGVARHPHDDEIAVLRAALKAHPCHDCPDREAHARLAERAWRARREVDRLERRMELETNSVARTFERVCSVLVSRGYLAGEPTAVTAEGRMLARLYTERDLLAAQCIRSGVWDGLTPPELAAVVSLLVHESRGEDGEAARLPSRALADAVAAMVRTASELADEQRAAGLEPLDPPDPSIAALIYRWAGGARLDLVLRDRQIAPGDFVRRCKQVVDLLDQIAAAAPQEPLQSTARQAARAVLRGVVATDRVD